MTHETSDLILELIELNPQIGIAVLTQAPGLDISSPSFLAEAARRKTAADDLMGVPVQPPIIPPAAS